MVLFAPCGRRIMMSGAPPPFLAFVFVEPPWFDAASLIIWAPLGANCPPAFVPSLAFFDFVLALVAPPGA